jgi:hypothetical protein
VEHTQGLGSAAATSGPDLLAEAWSSLARSVADAPAVLARRLREHPPNEVAEGYDYWAQVLTFGLRRELHYGDTRHPMFHRIGLDTKIGFDNPDNVYQIARIDPSRSYRVTGSRGTGQFVEFSVSVGFPGVVVPPRTVSKLDTTEIEVADDGTLELVVGGEPRERNWLAVDDEATSVLVRQVFGEWRPDDEPGDFRILTDDRWDGEPSRPLDPTEVATRLGRTARFVETQTRYWIDYVEGLRARIEPNTFERPGLQGEELVQVNAARAHFCWGLFDIPPDRALLVEVDAPPPHAYLGFHLVNYWLQSLDYLGRITSLNARQAHVDDDRRIRYVLAHRDPGVPNWLDVTGHRWGGMLFRTALTREAAHPTTTLLPLDAVRDALPRRTPVVDGEMRRAQLRDRRAHIASRFRW